MNFSKVEYVLEIVFFSQLLSKIIQELMNVRKRVRTRHYECVPIQHIFMKIKSELLNEVQCNSNIK